MNDKLIEKLKKLAARECWADNPDDFNPGDYSGGNYDDAYYGGSADGEALLAREILKELGINGK